MKKLDASNRHEQCRLSFRILSLFLLLHFSSNVSSASRMTPTVQEIFDVPQSYQQHIATLHGTVTNFQQFDPITIPKDFKCSRSRSFTLTDETGSIPILVLGFCGKGAPPPLPLPPKLNNGDVVSVYGVVQVLGPTRIPRQIIGADKGILVLANTIRHSG
jgi:hypothetical protein